MPYQGSGYRRDKATGRWLSPDEQRRHRERRERIAQMSITLSAQELEARIFEQKSVVRRIYVRLKLAEKSVDTDRARVYGALEDIRRITGQFAWLKVYASDPRNNPTAFKFLCLLLPKKLMKEPFAKPPETLVDLVNLRSSIEYAMKNPSIVSKLFGWPKRLEELRRALPELELAVRRARYESPEEIRSEGRVQNALVHEMAEALEIRKKNDVEVERKRNSEERRRYERARLAAIDEKTRQGIGPYRERVEFTGSCAYCEAEILRGVNAHLEHIIPVAKGGLNSVDNLVWVCDRCNLLKSDKSFHRFCITANLNAEAVVTRLHALGKYI